MALRGLVKRFDTKVAVAGVNLDVPSGSFFGLLGPNGAGKTTTLSMAVGLLRPTAGTAYVLGHDVWSDPVEAKRRLGVLPDGVRLFDRLSGAELLAYTGLLRGMDPGQVDSRARDLLDVLGLADAGRTLVVDYSAGMKKKIGLACALLHAPRLLVLDEPFEAVDPVSAALIRDILHRYVHSGGTVIFSSHVMEVVEKLCTHVAIMADGRDQVRRHPGRDTSRSRSRGGLRRGGGRPHGHRRGVVVAVTTLGSGRTAAAAAADGRLRPAEAAVDAQRVSGPDLEAGLLHPWSASSAAGGHRRPPSGWPRPAHTRPRTSATSSRSLVGAAVVLSWTLVPLLFFGVDETIDPARFALLPVPRARSRRE